MASVDIVEVSLLSILKKFYRLLGGYLRPGQSTMVSILELLWSAFSRIRTEFREILHISLYSVQMRGNADQNNSEY